MQKFEEYLSKADTRLSVIGYGFRDHHINQAILRAAGVSALKMCVVDPQGFDVISWQTSGEQIPAKSQLYQAFQPYFGGVSRRLLSSTFGANDSAEHAKVLGFLT